jgi:hypothetical protein
MIKPHGGELLSLVVSVVAAGAVVVDELVVGVVVTSLVVGGVVVVGASVVVAAAVVGVAAVVVVPTCVRTAPTAGPEKAMLVPSAVKAINVAAMRRRDVTAKC